MAIDATGINQTSFEALLYDYREHCRMQMPRCEKLPGINTVFLFLYRKILQMLLLIKFIIFLIENKFLH